jgi:hypothetical protein
LLSDSTLPQYEVYKKLVWERCWGRGRKSDEYVYEVIIMDDSLRKLLPDLVILIEIDGVQWLETASHMRERIFFTHSDPHGAAPFNGRFLAGMPDDDLLQRPIVA